MTRLALEHSVSRSETVRTRLELLFDDQLVKNISGSTVPPPSRAVIRVPRVDEPVRRGATENNV